MECNSFKSSLFNLTLVEFAPGFRVLQCFLVTLTLLFVNIHRVHFTGQLNMEEQISSNCWPALVLM